MSADEELAKLMRRAQAGDSDAYLQVLRHITPRIRRIVGRRRGFAGQAEVEDLVQDILLSMHAVRATYDPNRPFTPWLLAIVRSRMADGARRYVRQHTHDDVVAGHRASTRLQRRRRVSGLFRERRFVLPSVAGR